MIDIYFGEDYDMGLGSDGDLILTTEENSLPQRLTHILKLHFKEWFLNITEGIPYAEVIFEAGIPLEQIHSILYDRIKAVDEVRVINYLNVIKESGTRKGIVTLLVNDTVEVEVKL
jgi:hypothetical protein